MQHHSRKMSCIALDQKLNNHFRYKHGVIASLIDDDLLRRVRKEIVDGIHFTEKETDIYKIHQSGDLVNLDGLDNDSLKQLPSLLELRNAMYSAEFRDYISGIAGAGPLSGKKTDMAINVYTPGSHLLCHDDVIGSRRVSYILYLTDPDNPWQAEWGGALRLYPTRHIKEGKGPGLKTPDPDFSVSIPPAWNQMSFFSVQPGESFHDVEEVYHSGDTQLDGVRVRMAISGWYHIPQEGEEGYIDGAEEDLAASSSLTQLQTKDIFDVPQAKPTPYPEYAESASKSASKKPEDIDQDTLTAHEIDDLLQFISHNLLTPDGVMGLKAAFQEASCIRVDDFLGETFAKSLREEIRMQPHEYSTSTLGAESSSPWTVARPPHKQRYLFIASGEDSDVKNTSPSKGSTEMSLLNRLLTVHLPSPAFKKWLRLATGLVLRSYDIKARRFRHGVDYQLATSYNAENPRLELTLGISPKGKWETEDLDGEGKKKAAAEEINNGGYEVWMAPDDDEEEEKEITGILPASNGTGASGAHIISKEKAKPQASDPAIYQSSTAAEDDGILFSMAAGWNRLSLVLRDSGTHRFVKYVSKAAGADRWDVVGDWEVDWDATPEFDDEDEDEPSKADGTVVNESEEETVVADDDSYGDDTDDDDDDSNEKIRMSFM